MRSFEPFVCFDLTTGIRACVQSLAGQNDLKEQEKAAVKQWPKSIKLRRRLYPQEV